MGTRLVNAACARIVLKGHRRSLNWFGQREEAVETVDASGNNIWGRRAKRRRLHDEAAEQYIG